MLLVTSNLLPKEPLQRIVCSSGMNRALNNATRAINRFPRATLLSEAVVWDSMLKQ